MPRLAAVLLAVVVLIAAWSRLGSRFVPAGSVIDPPQPAPEIELVDTAGGTFRLSALRGKIVLVFFGYTYCPDVCPGTLKEMQFVFDQLGERGEDVRFVFITIDPARDDADRIRSYLDEFDPAYIGLTGSPAALEQVYADYSVDLEIGPATGTGGYDIEHTSRIFVVDRAGLLVETFPYGLSRQGILGDLQHLVSMQGN